MEAERPRPSQCQVKAQDEAVETDLAPPPAPFPTHLVEGVQINGHHASERLSVSSTECIDGDGADDQAQQAQIASLQRSIIDVLTDLLASSPNLDGPAALPIQDQRLATALTEMLELTYDLDSPDTSHAQQGQNTARLQDSFEALAKSLEELQDTPRTGSNGDNGHPKSDQALHPSVDAVREELAWARLDSLGSIVMTLVRERRDGSETESDPADEWQGEDEGGLPPRYSFDGAADAQADKAVLPDYSDPPATNDNGRLDATLDKQASESLRRSVSAPREKMMLELDGLTDAIDRLHSVIPRLNDQRIEMRASSSKTSVISPAAKARAERDKLRELEIIWDQIERTHGRGRSKDGQRVDTVGWEERRAKQVSESEACT